MFYVKNEKNCRIMGNETRNISFSLNNSFYDENHKLVNESLIKCNNDIYQCFQHHHSNQQYHKDLSLLHFNVTASFLL